MPSNTRYNLQYIRMLFVCRPKHSVHPLHSRTSLEHRCVSVPTGNGTAIPQSRPGTQSAMPPCQLNFVQWLLIYVGPRYESEFVSPFWRLISDMAPRFLENLCISGLVDGPG